MKLKPITYSYIIPTRRPEGPVKVIESIKKHANSPRLNNEIIVVDGDMGFAKKLNHGVAQATGSKIILLHDDCELTQGWYIKLPLPGHVGAFCLGENDDTFDTWGGFVDPPGYCTDPKENPDYSYWLCIPADIVDDIFPLDERFENPMFQDVDMGLTIGKAGYKIECLPGKIIHHNGDGSGAMDERQRGYVNRKWSIDL